MTLQLASVVCECGRPAEVGERCRSCYMRGYRRRQGDDKTWFDWVIVERAWAGKPLPRQLTNGERLHLMYFALKRGGYTSKQLGELVHLDAGKATRLAQSIATGEVQVMGRDVSGKPTRAMPAP